MYYYWDRPFVAQALRIPMWKTYRLVPATPSGRIRSDGILRLLNKSRIGIDEPVSRLPGDLLTPDEAVEKYAESGITLDELRRWTHRKRTRGRRRVVPHFRLNSHTIRFSAKMLDEWLAGTSKPTRGACA